MPNPTEQIHFPHFSRRETAQAFSKALPQLTEMELLVFKTVLNMGHGTSYQVSQKIADCNNPIYFNKMFGSVCRKIAAELQWEPNPARAQWVDLAVLWEVPAYKAERLDPDLHAVWSVRPNFEALRLLF